MPVITLKIKHSGKTYDLEVEPESSSGGDLKTLVFSLTGVPNERQKIIVKGGQLKDDADLSKLGFKNGQTLMVIGSATEAPKAPEKPVMWLEDMTDAQLAEATKTPGGLVNLGNTCYMNSTVQVLRAVPELQNALRLPRANNPSVQPSATQLTQQLANLYNSLSATTESYQPLSFWNALRSHVPQFQEMRNGQPAQQDAEEAWSGILSTLNVTVNGTGASDASSSSSGGKSWVEQYMTGQLVTTTKSAEAPEEPESSSSELFNALKCNIGAQTNFLVNGIQDTLEQDLEKNSPSLGRQAVYHATSKLARLPSYLSVHEVRFFWRRDINAKTKIMRKVKFPFELDLIDMVTDDLKQRIKPVNQRYRAIAKERRDRANIRKRTKQHIDDEVRESKKARQEISSSSSLQEGESSIKESEDSEPAKQQKEREELESLVDPSLRNDVGANTTGLYELVGIVSHKGASAEGGHYIAWVKANATSAAETLGETPDDPDKEQWVKFDDDKVSMVPQAKITTLEGGGEDSVAYLLLYRSVTF